MPKVKQSPEAIGLKAIGSLRLTPSVHAQAVSFYKTAVRDLKDSVSRRKLVFYAVYRAHGRRAHNIAEIASRFRFSERSAKEIIKDLALAHGINFISDVSAEEIAREYSGKLTEVPQEYIPEIEQLITRLATNHPHLRNMNPQKFAAAAIVLHLEQFGSPINDDDFREMIGVTDITHALHELRRLNTTAPEPLAVSSLSDLLPLEAKVDL